MSVKAGYSTPLIHASSVEDSIRFYQLLGFELIDTDRCNPLGWARMHCEGGAIMFLRTDHPADLAEPTMLYMYTPDLTALRDQLIAAGLRVPPIKYPHYMLSGEVTLYDPDGTKIFVGQRNGAEHNVWLEPTGRMQSSESRP
jgi:hypothetical protein